MTNIFGKEFKPTLVDPLPNRQGRSKKTLRIKVEHDGRVWIARYEGRPGACFGQSEREASYSLRAGAQW
jgi:hypothetical protein